MVDSTVKVALLEEQSFLFWRVVLALAPKTTARVYMDALGSQTLRPLEPAQPFDPNTSRPFGPRYNAQH